MAAERSRMDRHWVTIPMTAEGQAEQRPLLRAHPNPFFLTSGRAGGGHRHDTFTTGEWIGDLPAWLG